LIVSRAIPLPADTVFPALVGLASQSRWILATRVEPSCCAPAADPAPPHRPAAADPLAVGSRIIAHTGIGRLAVADRMQITAHEPPRRLTVRHTGRLVRGWGEFGVLPAGLGCRAYWAEEFELPFGATGRLGWTLLGSTVRAGIAVSLARLARGLADGSLVPADGGRRP
jgi:hypothetical protein